MDFFLIFAIINVIGCIAAWSIESKKGIRGFIEAKRIPKIKLPLHLVKTVFGFLPLAIDVLLTMGLISIFNFGGWHGGVLGLFASNLVSIVIIKVSSSI